MGFRDEGLGFPKIRGSLRGRCAVGPGFLK